jgi:N-acyl-D-aspartate/D-glutamate deacylase
MTLDLAIRGGTVVDGTGAPARRADVGVRDGVIVEVGTVADDAARTVDAEGCIVTPGFVDPHTHLDAQLCWDPAATPSCFHGVTTIVTGLCGFGIAPAPPDGGDYLLQSLEKVEEIPFECSRLGVEFTWGSFAEYRRHLATLALGVNVAGFVPHSALRYAVMGERARHERASDAEVAAMVAELRAAIDAGAVGFATSRGPNHVDAFGEPVPSRLADDRELQALVGACRGAAWQINVETKFSGDPSGLLAEVGTYERWTEDAGARLTWTPLHADPTSDTWRHALDHNHEVNRRGVAVAPQVAPEPITVMFRFDEWSYVVFVPGWNDVLKGFFDLPPDERVRRLRSDEFRRGLTLDSSDAMFGARLHEWRVAHSPSRPDICGRTIAAVAALDGSEPVDVLCDLVADDELATRIQVPAVNRDEAGRIALVTDPTTLIGLGDAGAHLTSITNYSYPTIMLADLVRDRAVLDLETAVARLTREPAEFLSLRGRGTLVPGAVADITVVDLLGLGTDAVRLARDLPGGGERLYETAHGYRAVVVGGRVSVEDDALTGAAAGTVV